MRRFITGLRRRFDDLPMAVACGAFGFACVSALAGGQGCASGDKDCKNRLESTYNWQNGAPDALPGGSRGGTVRVADGKVTLVSRDEALKVVWTIKRDGRTEDLW